MLSTGTATRSASASAIKTMTAGARRRPAAAGSATALDLDRAAAQREQAARPTLDEHDDRDQHQDLAEHRARIGLEEHVDDAEQEGADHGAPQIADAAEHHDHERVDDIALAEVRADVVELAQRDPGHAGDAGAEAEGQRIDPAGADPHRGGD